MCGFISRSAILCMNKISTLRGAYSVSYTTNFIFEVFADS